MKLPIPLCIKNKYDRIALYLFLTTLTLHMIIMPIPRGSFIFDEAHYIPACRKLLKGEAANNEHPPLAKLLISLTMAIFGDNELGWRFTPILFGSLSILVMYLLAKRFLSPPYTLIPPTLLLLDNMFFVHSSAALLDPSELFFIILAITFLAYGHITWSGIAFGFALLCKLPALFIMGGFILYLLLKNQTSINREDNKIRFLIILAKNLIQDLWKVIYTFILPALFIFLIGLSLYNACYHDPNFTTPLKHILFMFQYHSSLVIQKPEDFIYPWQWITIYPPQPYHIVNVNVLDEHGNVIDTYPSIAYYGFGTMPIWWSIWILLPYLAYKVFLSYKYKGESLPAEEITLIWILFSYFPFLLSTLLLNRVPYPFYYLHTVPALTMGLGILFSEEEVPKYIPILFILICLSWFIYFYPMRVIQ